MMNTECPLVRHGQSCLDNIWKAWALTFNSVNWEPGHRRVNKNNDNIRALNLWDNFIVFLTHSNGWKTVKFSLTCFCSLLAIYQEMQVTPSTIATDVNLGTVKKILHYKVKRVMWW